VVVVYKVDRLTRSLGDFAKIVEVFDAQGVSFVSVTQAFNTTSSTLIQLRGRGRRIGKRMFEPGCPPLEDIAREERITSSYATRLVRLTFLAPDIVAAILAGQQPAGLTANKLMADTRLPLDWRDQRAALGFA
jgi:hypothetical protein